jgi:hypothetical protein
MVPILLVIISYLCFKQNLLWASGFAAGSALETLLMMIVFRSGRAKFVSKEGSENKEP